MTKQTCSICGHPRRITYQEYDAEKRTYTTHTHLVGCLGHDVPVYLHNLNPEYDKYRMSKLKQKKKETK